MLWREISRNRTKTDALLTFKGFFGGCVIFSNSILSIIRISSITVSAI